MSDAKKNEHAVPDSKQAVHELTAGDIAVLAAAQAEKATQKAADAKAAADATAQEEYEAAAKEASSATADSKFTNKRAGEQIFRREMKEPEFWLTKEGLIPPRPMLSKEEEVEITRRVEMPVDQTPQYNPQHILSPEYHGVSNYENAIGAFKDELEQEIARLKKDPDTSQKQIQKAAEDISKMDTLYENFHIGMNVFRTAKGGRDKIKK